MTGCISLLGIGLVTLGALNAVLAMSVETCTQGGADSLRAGFITVGLYLLGGLAMAVSPPSLTGLAALVPATIIALWHSWFAIHFAYGFYVQGMSACYAMQGGFTPADRGEWMDGSEPMLIVLWLGLSAMFWIGLIRPIVLARREFRRGTEE